MRVNVYLPDELAATLRVQLPNVNISATLQVALRQLLGCHHEQLACAACAELVDQRAMRDRWLSAFYSDLFDRLYPLATRGGTAEGAARVVKDVGERHQISAALHTPLPRPSREQRTRQRVLPFPDNPIKAAPTKEHTA